MSRAVALAALALFGAGAGCHGHRDPGPADALVRFVADVGAGRRQAAWARLSTGTREAASELGAKQSPPVSGQALLLGGQRVFAHGLDDVTVVREDGDEAQVRATADDGSTQTVTLRREDGAWKVVLPLP